jgi:hypothetical protein
MKLARRDSGRTKAMDTNQDNGELARHQAMFNSVMKAATWSIATIIVILSLMAIFLL